MRALLAIACLSLGCGYRFVAPASTLPGGLQSVRVPVFSNQTPEPGAEGFFTQALRDVYLRAGKLGDDASDGRVEGTLLNIFSTPLVNTAGQPNYRLTVIARLVLFKGGTPVNSTVVSSSEEFPGGADLLWSETYRGLALRRLAEIMMRDGAERLSSGW